MGNLTRFDAGLRVAAPLLLAAAILVGMGAWIDDEHTDEAEAYWIARCDESQVPLLCDYLIRAHAKGDFEAVWEMASRRRWFQFERMSEGDPDDYWWSEAESVGIERSELVGREPGEIFVVLQRALAEAHPEEWRRQMDALRSLGPPEVRPGRTVDSHLIVEYQPRPGDLTAISFHFRRERGEWRLAMGFQRTLRTLARKVWAGLPKEPLSEYSEPPAIAIVEVGPGGIDEKQVARLAEHLHAFLASFHGDFVVILEITADLPFAEVFPALEALKLAECSWLCFADTTTNGRPPPGIRVNGVDLDDLEGLPLLPEDHPALDRIIMIRRE